MNVKHIHENAEPLSRLRAQAKLRRRNGLQNRKQLSVRGADDQSRTIRGDAIRIAEEGDAPERERRRGEGGPGREQVQQEIACEEQSNKAPTVGVNGNSQTAQVLLWHRSSSPLPKTTGSRPQ